MCTAATYKTTDFYFGTAHLFPQSVHNWEDNRNRKQTERPELIVPKMLAVINMADVYLKLGEIEKAGKCLKKIQLKGK